MHDDDSHFDEAVLKLKTVARVGQRIEAAQVQVMNLDRIAERAGDRWPAIAGRVRAGTIGFLTTRVDKSDIIVPCGDGFLIIFATLDEAAAKKRLAALEVELTAFYLGEEGLSDLQARMNHTSLSVEDAAALAAPAPVARTVGGHSMGFVPVWSARAQVIAGYFCAPNYDENGCFEFGYDPHYREHGSHDYCDFLDLDLALLEHVIATAAKHTASGARSVLGTCVHSSTLRRSHSRAAYLKRLAIAPAKIMQRVMMKVAEIEVGAPQGQIDEITRPLRGLFAQVGLEFHHRHRIAGLAALGGGLVGFQLPRQQGSAAQQQALLQLIASWRAACKPGGAKLFVDRFGSIALIRAAAPLIDFASSDRVWPVQREPGGVVATPLPPPETGQPRV